MARYITMMHQNIMEVLLNFHEDAKTPMKRVLEICMENMESISLQIKSVDELPDIPFTKPIVRKIQAALVSSAEPQIECEGNKPASQKRKYRKRQTKQSKKSTSVSESSMSSQTESSRPVPRQNSIRGQKRKNNTDRGSKITNLNGFIDQSTSSSTSSLPSISPRRVKCSHCNIWMEQHEERQHKRLFHMNVVPPNPTLTRSRSVRPQRQARIFGNQLRDFEYY